MIAEALAAAGGPLLARIGGPLGAAARQLVQTPRAQLMSVARAPIPAGLRGIDASWIEAALAELPPRARTALAGGALAPVDVWLARWACAAFPSLPPADPSLLRPTTPTDIPRLSATALRAWLEDVGADQLAFALGAQAAAAFGPRLVAAGARIEKPPRAGELGPRRAAIERARIAIDADALLRIGVRAISTHLDATAREAVIHRLPRGLQLRAELSTDAPGPSWRAATAP